MDRKEREMGALKRGKEEERIDIPRVEGSYREELFEAAKDNDLRRVREMLEKDITEDKDRFFSEDEWKFNPLRGVIMATESRVSVAFILLCHYGHELLVNSQDPHTNDTLLHLATQLHKDKLAIFFLKYLNELPIEKLHPFTKQCFLDAINHEGQTALHIATHNLLIGVVQQFVLENQIKINIKDKSGKTVFDVIKAKCETCEIGHDWKTPWRISIMLRGSGARSGIKLADYEEEEDMEKKKRHAEIFIMNDDAWNMTTNIILLISTLALTLVFAAIFTVPQTLTSGGDNTNTTTTTTISDSTKTVIDTLHTSLGHSIAFKVFVVSLTLACLVMIFVILVIVFTITSSHHMRALILTFSWACLAIMGIALVIAYITAIWIYMGYFFTSILLASGVFIALVALYFAYYFGLLKHFWDTLSSLISLTLLHGFIVTFLTSYFPKSFVPLILYICPFEE